MAAHASFSLGKTLALELEPSGEMVEVRRGQRITSEAVRLLSLRPDITLGGARDVRELVRRAELGAMVEPADLLMIMDTLRAGRNLRNNIVKTAEQRGGLDTLSFIADGIAPFNDGPMPRTITLIAARSGVPAMNPPMTTLSFVSTKPRVLRFANTDPALPLTS